MYKIIPLHTQRGVWICVSEPVLGSTFVWCTINVVGEPQNLNSFKVHRRRTIYVLDNFMRREPPLCWILVARGGKGKDGMVLR